MLQFAARFYEYTTVNRGKWLQEKSMFTEKGDSVW